MKAKDLVSIVSVCRPSRARLAISLLLLIGLAQTAFAQTGNNPLTIFKNYFVTGDYIVAGWVEGAADGSGFAAGTISIPDPKNPGQSGVPTMVPKGADIVAAYLYWGTVEGNQSLLQGQHGFFNGYPITGTVLTSPSGTVSWSSGGCNGSAQGSKTMRFYRADVRPYLPVDTNQSSPTWGLVNANTTYAVRLADSGSKGNTTPNALGASLVIIYRVLPSTLAPVVPLSAVVLYDGAYAPSNTVPNFIQSITGFYEPAVAPTAKITHIVAAGQPNKGETVEFGSNVLASLYTSSFGPSAPPFPGLYGSWDNPTWFVSNFVNGGSIVKGYASGFDTSESTTIMPASVQSGCVSWGAIVFSTTVQDSDGDGLLDVWEQNLGYTDVVSNNQILLPGASPNLKDIFVELDYLDDLDGSASTPPHSHLPKQAALDMVGNAFLCSVHDVSGNCVGPHLHFDLGVNRLGQHIYMGDPYVVPGGTGGNAISESALVCSDGATLCQFPPSTTSPATQPVIGWKGGLQFVRDNSTTPLGGFEQGRQQSYHYILFGHSFGAPRSGWSAFASALGSPAIPQLASIAVTSASTNNATVTIQSPPGVLKPGDCPNSTLTACSDANSTRITISGALGQPNLNGTYFFSNVGSMRGSGNSTVTTFTLTTTGVPPGTYAYSLAVCATLGATVCQPESQLGVAYLGPTSSSGHSDYPGGGDSMVTLGLWGADDGANCQPDPSQPLAAGQVYCNNEVGSALEQAGTLMHELGHTLTLTHGGTYYLDPNNPYLPTYELNCKPNFLSVMNYLFQARGFVDGGIDYSGQTLQPLDEVSLNETTGLGYDAKGQAAAHLTRWYSQPNSLDNQLQDFAKRHCDSSPLTSTDVPAVLVDGSVAPLPGANFSAPLDWNNDLVVPDTVVSPGEDLDYNGLINQYPFSGFNDWSAVDLRQTAARASAEGFSGQGGSLGPGGGSLGPGGWSLGPGGGSLGPGGGSLGPGGGSLGPGGGSLGPGGGSLGPGGGDEQDEDTANSTSNPPTNLNCTTPQNGVPGCVSSGTPNLFTEKGKSVPLTWSPPSFGQIRKYFVWRATGSFPTLQSVLANSKAFSKINTLSGTPLLTFFVDGNVKNNTTYTYFVSDSNKQSAQSSASNPIVVNVF